MEKIALIVTCDNLQDTWVPNLIIKNSDKRSNALTISHIRRAFRENRKNLSEVIKRSFHVNFYKILVLVL